MKDSKEILTVENLKKYFVIDSSRGKKKILKAVDDVSFSVQKGETLGLVGESGCGKTTLGRSVIRLYDITAGHIFFDDQEITGLGENELRSLRRRMQIIFQDPYASLNSRMTVGDIIAEPLDIHGLARGRERQRRVEELLNRVGLNAEHVNRYPHEFSGGQRQRIGIARALAVNPDFVVCDEPISALDVSIQAQVVNLLEELQAELGLTYLFIAHDLAMVKHISHRVGVMYLGQLVELTGSHELYHNPVHPYTRLLLSAIPIPDPDVTAKTEKMPEGEIPSPVNPPSGCRFRTRCPYAKEICSQVVPPLVEITPGHQVACHRAGEVRCEE
ncbi:MAG TPA: peptide ABC transporter ATP-binding protein [Syntrophomonas sp.]|jgi:oligopeptide transport system ATP-binding protein|nr:peptide ABC transporter ATP-binding protein [Syntrophomonas sp.]